MSVPTTSASVFRAQSRARAAFAPPCQLDPAEIPMAAAVQSEKVVYLLDPVGASRRSLLCEPPIAASKARSGRPGITPGNCHGAPISP